VAIPVGKTSNQLRTAARWLLCALLCVGLAVWWRANFRTWGALAAALAAVLAVWLIWRIVSGDRTVPGHPVYAVFVGPAAVLLYHLWSSGLGASAPQPFELNGSLDMSMMFHLFALAGAVMLCQSLLGGPTGPDGLVSALCGASMMLGAFTGILAASDGAARLPLALVGLGGAAVWTAVLVGRADRWFSVADIETLDTRLRRVFFVTLPVFTVLVLCWVVPMAGLICAAAILGLAVLVVLVLRWGKVGALVCAAAAAALATTALLAGPRIWPGPAWPQIAGGALGAGEHVFYALDARDSGLAILGGSVGWVGVLWLIGVGALSLGWMLRSCRGRTRREILVSLLWALAGCLAAAALLSPGGLFLPSMTLALAFTWGTLPAATHAPSRRRSGAVLLAALIVLAVLLGVTRSEGLAAYATLSFGLRDGFLHAVTGFFLALTLAWLAGVRRLWLGLAAIVLAASAGAAGEWLQSVVSRRNVEQSDLITHAVGAAVALVPYLLAMGSRGCESSDAAAPADGYGESLRAWRAGGARPLGRASSDS